MNTVWFLGFNTLDLFTMKKLYEWYEIGERSVKSSMLKYSFCRATWLANSRAALKCSKKKLWVSKNDTAFYNKHFLLSSLSLKCYLSLKCHSGTQDVYGIIYFLYNMGTTQNRLKVLALPKYVKNNSDLSHANNHA